MITIVKSWLIHNGLIKREAFVNVDTVFYKEMYSKYSSENPLISFLPMFKNYIRKTAWIFYI